MRLVRRPSVFVPCTFALYHTRTHAHTHTFIHTHSHTFIHTHSHTFTHTHVRAHTHIEKTRTQVHAYECAQARAEHARVLAPFGATITGSATHTPHACAGMTCVAIQAFIRVEAGKHVHTYGGTTGRMVRHPYPQSDGLSACVQASAHAPVPQLVFSRCQPAVDQMASLSCAARRRSL